MKPLAQWTEADLQELIGTSEGQSIEFKQSAAINFGSDREKRIRELVKDVSAMANAAGGRIFYGIAEEKGNGRAERLDGGIDESAFNLDQIGNLLTGNIEPAIPGVTTHAIRLKSGGYAIAIEVPQSMNLAPHQSRIDHVYHRRHDRKTLAMFDHEIRDVMRRAETPVLSPVFTASRPTADGPFAIEIGFQNEANTPAMFYILDVGLDARIQPTVIPKGWGAPEEIPPLAENYPVKLYQRAFMHPNALPLFKPRPIILWTAAFHLPDSMKYRLYLSISSAGFHDAWDGHIWSESGVFQIKLEQESKQLNLDEGSRSYGPR
jgi:hypothetical protein